MCIVSEVSLCPSCVTVIDLSYPSGTACMCSTVYAPRCTAPQTCTTLRYENVTAIGIVYYTTTYYSSFFNCRYSGRREERVSFDDRVYNITDAFYVCVLDKRRIIKSLHACHVFGR